MYDRIVNLNVVSMLLLTGVLIVVVGGGWGFLMDMLFDPPISTVASGLGGFVIGAWIANLVPIPWMDENL